MAGKDTGKQGEVLKVLRNQNKVVVREANIVSISFRMLVGHSKDCITSARTVNDVERREGAGCV